MTKMHGARPPPAHTQPGASLEPTARSLPPPTAALGPLLLLAVGTQFWQSSASLWVLIYIFFSFKRSFELVKVQKTCPGQEAKALLLGKGALNPGCWGWEMET